MQRERENLDQSPFVVCFDEQYVEEQNFFFKAYLLDNCVEKIVFHKAASVGQSLVVKKVIAQIYFLCLESVSGD